MARRIVKMSEVSSAFTRTRLHNLVSLYGRVRAIRLDAKSKRALVEMSTSAEAERVVQMLDGAPAFLRSVRCHISKRSECVDNSTTSEAEAEPMLEVPPTTSDWKRPSRRLFFSALPRRFAYREASLRRLLLRCGCPRAEMPRSVHFYSKCSGVIEFESVQTALEAVAVCNNTDRRGLDAAGRKGEETIRLCFH